MNYKTCFFIKAELIHLFQPFQGINAIPNEQTRVYVRESEGSALHTLNENFSLFLAGVLVSWLARWTLVKFSLSRSRVRDGEALDFFFIFSQVGLNRSPLYSGTATRHWLLEKSWVILVRAYLGTLK